MLYLQNYDTTLALDFLSANWSRICLSRALNHGALWHIVFLHLRNSLTYLLTTSTSIVCYCHHLFPIVFALVAAITFSRSLPCFSYHMYCLQSLAIPVISSVLNVLLWCCIVETSKPDDDYVFLGLFIPLGPSGVHFNARFRLSISAYAQASFIFM